MFIKDRLWKETAVKYVLITLMVLDIFGVLVSTSEIVFLKANSNNNNNSEAVGGSNNSEETKNKDDDTEYSSEMLAAILLEALFEFTVLLVCNSYAYLGLVSRKPHLLVPWLGVYLIGFTSAYIAGISIIIIKE